MRLTKLILAAGLALAGVGGAAAADPYYANEPAPGTYENGYVWVGGYWGNHYGQSVWVPGHWEVAQPQVYVPQPRVIIAPRRYERPRYWHRWHPYRHRRW